MECFHDPKRSIRERTIIFLFSLPENADRLEENDGALYNPHNEKSHPGDMRSC